MLTIYKPGQLPVRGLRTSLKGAQLGDGFFQAIDNLRWDSGALTVRNGVAALAGTTPGTVCLGAWAGALNGVYYVVSGWVVSGSTAIYTTDLAGAYPEITSPSGSLGGNGSGKTRLSSTTAHLRFTVATTPRRVVGGTVSAPRDLLVVQNGVDYPLIFDPLQSGDNPKLVSHQNVKVPDGALTFKSIATLTQYFQVRGSLSAKSYFSAGGPPQINQGGSCVMAQSAVPYTLPDPCINLAIGPNVATNPIGTCKFTVAANLAGEQLCMVVDATTAMLGEILSRCAIDLGVGSGAYNTVTTWDNVYDPTSTDTDVNQRPIIVPMDIAGTRVMLVFNMRHLGPSRTYYHIRFVRKTKPTGNSNMIILAIMSAGAGKGFPCDTEFSMAYSDTYSLAESGSIVSSRIDIGELVNCGGPADKDNGTSSLTLPRDPSILYDFMLEVKNVTTSDSISGGLNGIAQNVDIYFRTKEEALESLDAQYWASAPIFKPASGGATWAMQSPFKVASVVRPIAVLTTWQIGYGANSPADRYMRDPGVPAPSSYNVAMPRAAAVWSTNGRTFAGNILDDFDHNAPGDLYFSARMFPFRYQSVQSDEESGSRLVFEGETVKAGIMAAAAANGASTVYVLTDQSFNALGTAGGFIGSGYDATSLSTRVRINAHGTNEPFSVAERSGIIFYIDQEGQIVRFEAGSAASISRNAVDDKTKNIRADRRGTTSAAFWKDRYYLAYSPAGATQNTHILGWNEAMQEWEFDDTLPSTVCAQKVVRAYDSAQLGSGQRMLLFSNDGKVYGFEEGIAEPGNAIGPMVRLRTREYQTEDLNLFRFGTNQVMIDHHPQVASADVQMNVDCYYKPRNSQFGGTINCTDSEAKPQAIRKDLRLRGEVTATGQPENGWSGFVEFSGHLGTAKTIWRIESDVELLSKGAGER